MTIIEEPSYLAFARDAIRRDNRVSPTIARELVNRIDRDASALKAAQAPVALPDRDDLARELFVADNSSAPRALCVSDFIRQKAEQGEALYVYDLADAAIAAFKRANP